jgi:hypothetical protein
MKKYSAKFVRLLTIALIFFRTIANTAIASNAPKGDGDSPENIVEKFVHLVLRVPMKDISVRKIEEGRSGYNALVFIQGRPLYVFKMATPAEIKSSKKFFSLTNAPKGISFVGVSHFGSQKDLKEGKVFQTASTSYQEIANLDLNRYYSLQSFVDATRGMEIIKGMKMERDCDLVANYGSVAEKMGQTVAYMHSNGIAHGDFHANNWLWDPQTKKFFVIDWEASRNLDLAGDISQSILSGPDAEDIRRALETLLGVALAHKFSRPSIALIKTFFHGISVGLDKPLPDKFIWQWEKWFGNVLADWLRDGYDFIITFNDLANDLKEGRKIVRIAGLVQIINAAQYHNFNRWEEVPPIVPSIDRVKRQAVKTAEFQMKRRIESRQETEDLEKVKAEESKKLQEQIAVWDKILADVSPEELYKLYDNAHGGRALMNAILAELAN